MKKQRGAALMVILVILGVVGAYFALKALNSGQAQREMETANTLAQARESLIGFAANYRADHPAEALGYLPCPDTNNNGNTEANCATSDYGRLPWRTLRTPALRDGSGTCLWYAVSASAKDSPKTTPFNWDTIGQFIIRDDDGKALAAYPLNNNTAHDRPLAVIIAPHKAINGQLRPSAAGTVECDGGVADAPSIYLDNMTTANTIVLSSSNSFHNETNNDRGVWVTSQELFNRVKYTPDFKSDIDTLMTDLVDHLNNLPAASLPAASGSKGVDMLVANFLAIQGSSTYGNTTLKYKVLNNWKDNLLYTGPITASVNGTPGCAAVLLFGGERQGTQSRTTAAEKLLIANYLEAPNTPLFPGNGDYTGNKYFNALSASSDVVRCIIGLPAGATQKSFANDFSSFNPVGSGVTANPDKSVSFVNAGGTSGGCFWFNTTIPLAGKTLRAYYDFKFDQPDAFTLNGGTDRGNGFSLQMIRNDLAAAPTGCGAESNMGVLTAGAPFGYDPNGNNSLFGQRSIIFETDVRRDAGHTDPAENHTAIMFNGTLNHALTGTMSATCDGSASGCRHSPSNKFEESPPENHRQRIEISTGCNATCSACNPANHIAPNTFARISNWVDCKECSDIASNLDHATKKPSTQRCINLALYPELNTVYFGFTGGFRAGTAEQSVTLQNFILRSE